MKEPKSSKSTRRNFLMGIGALGIGAVATPIALVSESTKGKKIKMLNQNNELVEVDVNSISKPQSAYDQSYKKEQGRVGLEGKNFVMVVDLELCKNARKCMKSCQAAHQLRPEQHHINVLEIEDVNGATTFMPKPCQHCDNPPCVSVCPVDATFKRQDGIVLIDNQRCIGCRFCVAACPYSARSFNWTEPRDADKYKDVEYDVEKNVPQRKGTVTKCAFSADRLREGKLPYCVSACPNGVYYFGDKNEDLVTNGTTKKTVRLSQLLKDRSAYTLLPELGTNPNVFYLPKVKK